MELKENIAVYEIEQTELAKKLGLKGEITFVSSGFGKIRIELKEVI